MENSEFEHPLMPSILDRLMGQARPTQDELRRNKAILVRQKKDAIQRDLQNLFNTRWQITEIPPGLDELSRSLVRFGIPDFTGASATSLRNREDFLETLRQSVERFEPRLRRVRLELTNPEKEPIRRELRFRIYAVLVTELDAEEVEFVSVMEPASGTFSVRGD